MVQSIADLHEQFKKLVGLFITGTITMEVLTEALEILKNEANEAGLPFVFSDAAIQQRFNCFNNDLPANDDNVPFLTTLEELDEELSENSEGSDDYANFYQNESSELEDEGSDEFSDLTTEERKLFDKDEL